jgi:hypothetical protein
MSLRKSIVAASVALSMVAVPAVAHAADAAASKLSVRAAPAVSKVARSGAAKRDANNLGGSVLIAVLAAAAVIAGVVVAADGSDAPTSP